MNDPLDLLDHSPAPSRRDPLRRHLFDRTVRELRRQGCRRRLRSMGALAAAFAAGVCTLVALLPSPPPTTPTRSMASRTVEPRVESPDTPTDREWQAVEAPTRASALYRQAADDYLRRGEHADALRCYGNALDEARPRDLEVNGDDSWLLIALKHARKKERDACARE